MEIEQNVWAFTPEGEAVIIYSMRNACGAEVRLTNLGAAIVSLSVPDRDGRLEDVLLGYPAADGYINDGASIGKVVGRYGGLIPSGRFVLGGEEYFLPRNDGGGHRDGGPKGFGSLIWESRVEVNRVVFTLFSPDGDQGYPGNLTAEIIYDWDDDNVLEVTFLAKSEADTMVNLSVNPYFALGGPVSEHVLATYANGNVLFGESGNKLPVPGAGFPGDRGTVKSFAEAFGELCFGWELTEGGDTPAVELHDPVSGRSVSVYTSHGALYVDPGTRLQGNPKPRSGGQLRFMDGVALRAGAMPFREGVPPGAAVLTPDDIYRHNVVYRFSVER